MSIDIAQHAIRSGADAIGYMFYEGSKRYINIHQAEEINSVITPFVSTVAVVANQEIDFIKSMIKIVRPDYIQFHGDETPEFCRIFGVDYIKAIRVRPDSNLEKIEAEYDDASAIMLDTYNKKHLGGTGESFNWNMANYKRNKPVIIAGGLDPENVCQAIKISNPYGVDVSSGVESDEHKDSEKITQFCNNVMHCDC